jgi:hypothetical protein
MNPGDRISGWRDGVPYDEPGAFDTSRPGNEHALCDHENDDCQVWPDDEDCSELGHRLCGDCGACEECGDCGCDDPFDPREPVDTPLALDA